MLRTLTIIAAGAAAAPALFTATSARCNESAARSSVEELAVLAEHGEIDERGAASVLGTVAHGNAAEIEARHGLQPLDQFFARRLRSGALESFDEHLGGDETLDGSVGRQHVASFDRLQELAGYRRGHGERIRRDLADNDAVDIAFECFDE